MRYESSHEHLLGGAGCEIPLPPTIKAPKKNVWHGLAREDTHQVEKFVMRQKELEMTNRKNYVSDVEFMTPNKSDVCQYL